MTPVTPSTSHGAWMLKSTSRCMSRSVSVSSQSGSHSDSMCSRRPLSTGHGRLRSAQVRSEVSQVRE